MTKDPKKPALAASDAVVQPHVPTTSQGKVLDILSTTSGYITLAIDAGTVLVPLVKGLILGIEKILGVKGEVTYQILISTDAGELEDVKKLAADDVAAINAELTRLGLPTVPVPSSS